MNKILLINPPFSQQEEYKFWISSLGTKAYPPLGLAYIASLCLERGYAVEIIDALAEELSLAELKTRITKANPAIVGVTATTPMINNAVDVLTLVKECSSSILTVLGGPHISAAALLTMQECKDLDVGVLGEGEETFTELVKEHLTSHKELSRIVGIIYRRNGQIIMNSPRPYIKDINEIPIPAYHLLPMRLYASSPLNYRRAPAISMLCSRGCPFQCVFCTKNLFGNVVRRLPPQKVYAQIKYLVENYKIKEVHFYDDTFILDEDWVKKVCSYLERLDIWWWCNARVNNVTPEILSFLKRAGCYRIYYGVESGNEKSLKLLKKETTLQDIKYAFKITREAHIEAGAFMMLGIPQETREDIERSIGFVKEIKADHAVFTMLTPYPGTEIYRDYKKYGMMRKTSWREFIMISHDPIFIPYSTTKEELNRYLTRAYKSIVFSSLFIRNKIKDIFYSPKKIFFYVKGLILVLREILTK